MRAERERERERSKAGQCNERARQSIVSHVSECAVHGRMHGCSSSTSRVCVDESGARTSHLTLTFAALATLLASLASSCQRSQLALALSQTISRWHRRSQ